MRVVRANQGLDRGFLAVEHALQPASVGTDQAGITSEPVDLLNGVDHALTDFAHSDQGLQSPVLPTGVTKHLDVQLASRHEQQGRESDGDLFDLLDTVIKLDALAPPLFQRLMRRHIPDLDPLSRQGAQSLPGEPGEPDTDLIERIPVVGTRVVHGELQTRNAQLLERFLVEPATIDRELMTGLTALAKVFLKIECHWVSSVNWSDQPVMNGRG